MALRRGCICHVRALSNIERRACRLAIKHPLCRKLDTRIPSANTGADLLTNLGLDTLNLGFLLTFNRSLTSTMLNDFLPYIATSREGCGGRGKWTWAVRRMVLYPPFDQLKVVPDLSRLVVPTVWFLWQNCDVCPSRSANRVSTLLKFHNAFVQKIVVPCAQIDKDAARECGTEISRGLKVCDDIIAKIKWCPVRHSF